MDYSSLLFDIVETTDVFTGKTGHKRVKIRNGAAPTHAFMRDMSNTTKFIAGIDGVYESDEPNARYELVFDPQVKKHKAVAEQFVEEMNAQIRVKGADGNPIISEWLYDTREDKGLAEPSQVGTYGNYDRERS